MKWFHHDTDMHRNRKIRKLIRTHGATGYGFWCLLLEKIYEGEGNFQIEADPLWIEDIAEELRLGDYRAPIRILDTLAELGLIDPQLWADHVIYAPGVATRGDTYVVKRTQEREKKRRQRERKKTQKQVVSPGDNGGTKGQNADLSPSDPDTDLDTDPDPNSLSIPTPPPSRERESLPLPAPGGEPAQPVGDAITRVLEQVAKLREDYIPPALVTEWHLKGLLPWRDRLRQLDPKFVQYVGKQISFNGDAETMHPQHKGRRHLERLEKTCDGIRQVAAYWTDWQANRPPAPIAYEIYDPSPAEILAATRKAR